MLQNIIQSHSTLRVRRRAEIAVNALLLELESASGEVLPEWPPGAHLDIRLPSGLTRQYSLCGAREDRSTYVLVVLREPHGRGGSEEIFREFGVGTEFISSTPRDHFRLVDASEYVLIAGGIGITPIKAMVDELRARGARWHLHYGGRSREHMAFLDELVDLGGDNVSIVPQDVDGLLDVRAIIGNLSPEAAIYCCGPAPLLDAVLTACAEAGPLSVSTSSASCRQPTALGLPSTGTLPSRWSSGARGSLSRFRRTRPSSRWCKASSQTCRSRARRATAEVVNRLCLRVCPIIGEL